jgi:hypothetical protein
MAHQMAIEWFKRRSKWLELVEKYDALRADPRADETAVEQAKRNIEALIAEIQAAQTQSLRGEWND